MCNFENGFILCTCKTAEATQKNHQKNSRRYKNSSLAQAVGYRWSLSRFVNKFEPIMEGQYEPASADLGAGLNVEWVLLHLNCEKCFDFEYKPEEGDNLTMRGADKWRYMSFIFRAGEWFIDYYDGFSTTLELRLKGEIKPLPAPY